MRKLVVVLGWAAIVPSCSPRQRPGGSSSGGTETGGAGSSSAGAASAAGHGGGGVDAGGASALAGAAGAPKGGTGGGDRGGAAGVGGSSAVGGSAGVSGSGGVGGSSGSCAGKGAGSPCASEGECTGDGRCVPRISSCEQATTPGCGVVSIPGGTFVMGQVGARDAEPLQPAITVGPFAVDAYEITVARFRVYWDAGMPHESPLNVVYPNASVVSTGDMPRQPLQTSADDQYNWTGAAGDRETWPLNRISWNTAMHFCAWDGGRLPTEAEWEFLARYRPVDGLDPGRTYPWGEAAPTCELALSGGCNGSLTGPAGSRPAQGGVYDLGGSLWEWTADGFEAYGGDCWPGLSQVNPVCVAVGNATVRGGARQSSANDVKSASRAVGGTAATIGARCVRDLID